MSSFTDSLYAKMNRSKQQEPEKETCVITTLQPLKESLSLPSTSGRGAGGEVGLYHNFIARGDLSILFGEPGVGKTLFAYYLGLKLTGRSFNEGVHPAKTSSERAAYISDGCKLIEKEKKPAPDLPNQPLTEKQLLRRLRAEAVFGPSAPRPADNSNPTPQSVSSGPRSVSSQTEIPINQSSNQPINPARTTVQSGGQSTNQPQLTTVLYYCFEMDPAQLLLRYPNLPDVPNFFRSTLQKDMHDKYYNFESIASSIMNDLDKVHAEDHDTVLILDNIKATSYAALAFAKEASRVMLFLKNLCSQYRSIGKNLTVVVLAHTGKSTTHGRTLELNHLAGAKELQLYADSAIGIIQSAHNPNFKLIKHLKSRNLPLHSKCLLLQSVKDKLGNHTFKERSWCREADHIVSGLNDLRAETMIKASKLKDTGKSIRDIAAILSISKSTVGRYIKDASRYTEHTEPRNSFLFQADE